MISKGKSDEFIHLQKSIEAENRSNNEVILQLKTEIRELESKILEYKASFINLNAVIFFKIKFIESQELKVG